MDAASIKAFHVKVRSLDRILKQYKSYKAELETYDLNQVSQDKKKQEFYLQSKSALEQVEKKLLDYFHQLKTYMIQNKETLQSEEEEVVKTDYEMANSNIQQIQNLLPAAC